VDTSPKILSGEEVQALPEEEPEFYLNPYIPKDAITFIFGKYGTFKTPLTLHMAKAIATGSGLWGLDVIQASPILYIEVDTPRPVIVPRMKKIILPPELDIAFMGPSAEIHEPNTSWDLHTYDMLKRAHAAKHYKVVFIDALRGVHSLDDKLSESPHAVYKSAAKLFPGASIVFIHHARKTKADDTEDLMDEGFSGSNAWVNHATVAVRVVRKKGSLVLRHTKSQASELSPPLELVPQDDGANFDLKTDATIHTVAPLVHDGIAAGMTKHAIDRMVSEKLGVSIRTATRRRLEMETLEKKGIGVADE